MTMILSTSLVFSEEAFQEIIVGAGDTMWSIANKYLKDPQRWPEIVKYNSLPTPDPTIALPGMRIRVPITLVKEEYRNAELLKMTPVVKYKRNGTDDWKEANAPMTLKYQDSLRTLKGAQAQVRFPSREVVIINENSYVVLKPEKILQEIQLLQGDLRASRAKIVLPQGTVVKPQGGDSDYQAKVRDDETEVVFVYKGKVDVTAQGKTVTVPEGFGTQVPKGVPPMAPQPLKSFSDFDPANLNTPLKDMMSITPKGNVAVKTPSMKPVESKNPGGSKAVVSKSMMSSYHMQLASDPDFRKIIIEKTQNIGAAFDASKEAIPDGTYYMRVAFIDALGVKSPYSEPSTVIKDTQAPVFRNVIPEDGRAYAGSDSFADVSGVVEGATHFSINDEVLFISSSGRFEKAVSLHEGQNVLNFYAKDASGNETKLVRKVTYTK
jgi:hypothetical protein